MLQVPTRRWAYIALTFTALAVTCDGARILALFPSPSRSHIISYEALTKELAARGHQVTVVSSFPQEKALANYTDIAVPLNRFGMDELDMFNVKIWDMMSMMLEVHSKMCENYLEHEGVQKLIHSKDEHFDLIIISMVFNECLLGFVHKYQANVIGVSPMGGTHFMLDTFGNTSPYSYVPNLFHKYSDRMNFKERLYNTMSTTLLNVMRNYLIVPDQDALMRKYFSDYEPIPNVFELERKISMLFLNTHVSISYPRPYLPNTIEVGGMHIRQPKKLPQDIQKFLDEAKDGVIYFSLGSNLQTSKMSEEKKAAFVSAFSNMKQRVLWKSDTELLPGLSSNVKLGKWLPQIDILAHPNVKVFITHGGLLSTQEAIYYNVPVVGIPIFGDQDLNMNRAQQAGYGLLLEYKNVTSESVQWAVNAVLQEKSYKETIQELSALFRDQPHTPLQQAVYWTEYVLRHDGAHHMRSAALDLAWYQYFLLDVIGLMALCLAVIGLVAYKAIKAVKKYVCSSMCSKKVKKVKQNKKNK